VRELVLDDAAPFTALAMEKRGKEIEMATSAVPTQRSDLSASFSLEIS
jgi:hypothetical protein